MSINSSAKRPLRLFLGLLILVLVTAVIFADAAPGVLPVAEAAPPQQDLPVISFERATDSIIEPDDGDDTTITINVRISRAPAQEARVAYSTANGSATAGVDYEATSGELVFPAGATDVRSFEVTIYGNNSDEPNRTFVSFLTNPVNATVGSPSSTTITIVDNDQPVPTNTPTATPGGPTFIDNYEPNNEFATAYETAANAAKLTKITLWPKGDEDFFKFYGKRGDYFQVYTTDLTAGIDTLLKVYDPNGNKLAENDDVDVASRRSQVQFRAREDGFYFARIIDTDPSDSTNKTYSFGVDEIVPPTATPTATRIAAPDTCEANNSLETACLIGPGQVVANMNFVPPEGTGTDNDFYRLPVKAGVLYTCETQNLTAVTDTNMIFLNNHGGDFVPPLGNDDRTLGDRSSELSWYATYTGNLYILIGPVGSLPYADTPQTGYDLLCTSAAATATPPPTATLPPAPPSSGGGQFVPSPTPFPTPSVTPETGDAATPTRRPPPVPDFRPLPTATLPAGAEQFTTVQVTIYYDSNFNNMPELTEGIMDVAVGLYDNAAGTLVAFGFTNEAGVVRFDSIRSSGAVRVEVPFLNFTQVVTGASANILLRVEPRPLPSGIP